MNKSRLGPEARSFPPHPYLSAPDGRANFMTAAWCGIASSKPPAISVAIRSERHTLKGILTHAEFSINVRRHGWLVDFCGIYSGRADKSELFDLFEGDLKYAPLVAACPVNLECPVTPWIWAPISWSWEK
jgi:flavin reductase (DIM6/NTAB) family NADH-FMN oxidoreductase RutF